MSDTTATELPAPAATRSRVTTDIAFVSTFAAFIAVCALLPGIPTGTGVPVTLQTFGVILAGLVLGWRRGALAVLLYLALGLAGLPIFAQGHGGLGVLAGPSVGYLLAFPFAAALAGLLAGGATAATGYARYAVLFSAGLFGSLVTIHVAGIAGLMVRLDLPFDKAFAADAVFLPGDVLKNAAAAAVAYTLFRAYPDLLRTRR
ncbi:biotin transporter BioY [Cellulomonas sp. HZM]|uniref:biotin transporter BioY n=1 Tax=Cellulomonas sp. HZM TaxID=1454010 RepID=UPI0004937DA0|nr:biotin transporter BioY [Cellulomonas sp. HZM]